MNIIQEAGGSGMSTNFKIPLFQKTLQEKSVSAQLWWLISREETVMPLKHAF